MKKLIVMSFALLVAAPAFAATESTPGTQAPSLSSVKDAEDYLAARGVILADKAKGVHAVKDGKTLYDEYQYDTDGKKVSILLFQDASEAAAYTSVLAKTNKDARTVIRGKVVFVAHDDATVEAIKKTGSTSMIDNFGDAEDLLVARGIGFTEKGAAAVSAVAVMHSYELESGTKIAIYRFDDASAASRFVAGIATGGTGTRAVEKGRVVFVVPGSAPDAAQISNLLAAK